MPNLQKLYIVKNCVMYPLYILLDICKNRYAFYILISRQGITFLFEIRLINNNVLVNMWFTKEMKSNN